jgi:hypothetical protein
MEESSQVYPTSGRFTCGGKKSLRHWKKSLVVPQSNAGRFGEQESSVVK